MICECVSLLFLLPMLLLTSHLLYLRKNIRSCVNASEIFDLLLYGDSNIGDNTFKSIALHRRQSRSLSSQIVQWIRVFVASGGSVVVRAPLNLLVADVTKHLSAILALNHVGTATLAIYASTGWALAAHFDIYVWMFIVAHILLYHLKCHFDRLEVPLIGPVVRPLLKVLLTFGLGHADPAEPSPALDALNLRATTTDQRDVRTTLDVRAALCAMLQVELVEFALNLCVPFCYLSHLLSKLDKKVDPMNEATLEWMNMLLAVKAEVVLTMLAPT